MTEEGGLQALHFVDTVNAYAISDQRSACTLFVQLVIARLASNCYLWT